MGCSGRKGRVVATGGGREGGVQRRDGDENGEVEEMRTGGRWSRCNKEQEMPAASLATYVILRVAPLHGPHNPLVRSPWHRERKTGE